MINPSTLFREPDGADTAAAGDHRKCFVQSHNQLRRRGSSIRRTPFSPEIVDRILTGNHVQGSVVRVVSERPGGHSDGPSTTTTASHFVASRVPASSSGSSAKSESADR